nr:gamma-butyrobetaine dioxygenase [Quercus suber]
MSPTAPHLSTQDLYLAVSGVMSQPMLRGTLRLNGTKPCIRFCARGTTKPPAWRSFSIGGSTSSNVSPNVNEGDPRFQIRRVPTHGRDSQASNSAALMEKQEVGMAKPKLTIEHPILQSDSIAVAVDGSTRLYSPLLLRDNCRCESCVDASTKQKLFCTSDIPADIQVASTFVDGTGVSVRWKSDVPGFDAKHTTHIDMSQLRGLSRDGSTTSWPSPPKRVVWDTAVLNADVEDIDYHAYMEDDFALHTAVQQLHTHGLLFLTNVPEDSASVVKITERIGPVKNTFYGFTWDVRSVPQAKNVAYTSQDLGFHMDLMYMEQAPHIQFLHCIRSSSLGGASLFTDSFKAVRDLSLTDLTAFQDLCQIEVPFHYDHPESHYYYRKRTTIEIPDPLRIHNVSVPKRSFLHRRHIRPELLERIPVEQVIDAVSWSPPFQAPFSVQSNHAERFPMIEELYGQGTKHKQRLLARAIATYNKHAAKFNALIHRPEGIYERMMKPGECVLFDNRRVLHARRAFEVADAGKERWLRGSYLDRDPFKSKLRTLQDRFGELPVKSQQMARNATFAEQTDAVAATT